MCKVSLWYVVYMLVFGYSQVILATSTAPLYFVVLYQRDSGCYYGKCLVESISHNLIALSYSYMREFNSWLYIIL